MEVMEHACKRCFAQGTHGPKIDHHQMLPRLHFGVEVHFLHASGSDDTPTRAVPISLYPRDGELPCNISTSSSAFPPPSQELPGRGADWKGPWIRIDGTLHAPCATFSARCQIHLFKSCQEQSGHRYFSSSVPMCAENLPV